MCDYIIKYIQTERDFDCKGRQPLFQHVIVLGKMIGR